MKLTIETTIVDDAIIAEIRQDIENQIDFAFRSVIDLRDRGVCEALISMGWTPPENIKKMLDK